MEEAFNVKTGEFEGPLELLLNLIEERKLLISDVSISKVADDFLEYLKGHIAFPVGQAAHFVVVAATLLLIKSRSLLPVLALSDEEEGDVKDLEFRLKIFQMIRNAAKGLLRGASLYLGSGARITDPIFSPAKDLSIVSLEEAARRVLQNAPRRTFAPEVSVKTVISLEEMIDRLSKRVEKALKMTFTEFAGTSGDKAELVVGFLALLELIKRGLLLADQSDSFGEITMNYGGAIKAPNFE